VETNLVGEGGWSNFPRQFFTPVEMIPKVVLMLVDGVELNDAKGVKVPAEKAYGQTVEINLNNYYIRGVPEFCDDAMKAIMEATSVESESTTNSIQSCGC
jgi:FKBP-type peptidyl-prolyl cis-trans isomerase 2